MAACIYPSPEWLEAGFDAFQSDPQWENKLKKLSGHFAYRIQADEEACRMSAERSLALATALNPAIGYEEAAKLAKEALEKNVPIRELARKKGLLGEEQLAELLDLRRMTEDPTGAGKMGQ